MLAPKKILKVVGEGMMMDAEVNCATAEDAYEFYNQFIKRGYFPKVYVIDNETGEVYAYYHRELEGGGGQGNQVVQYWRRFIREGGIHPLFCLARRPGTCWREFRQNAQIRKFFLLKVCAFCL